MTGSIATSPAPTPAARPRDVRGRGRLSRGLATAGPLWVGVAFASVAIAVYLTSNPARPDFYDHFVWQADAFLDGRAEIAWPTAVGPFTNHYFQDVYPIPGRPGWGLLPFPPLPAVILMPFVAVFGLATNSAVVAAVLGGINVGLCWRMLMRITQRSEAAVLATLFYGFGTVAWYAAMLGSTWFFAHVVASTFLFLAITAAVDAEARWSAGAGRLMLRWIEPRQFVAGLLFGIAALSRLTTILGAPFFTLVGGGGTLVRRAFSAGLGAVIPVALLLGYNVATTGHVFHPGYEWLYQNEYTPRPELLHRDDWAIEDPRYVPQNTAIMLAWPPLTPLLSDERCTDPTHPDYSPPPSGLGLLFDRTCPLLRPDPLGMSLLLTSPGYLLAIPALRRIGRRRLVAAAALAVGAIALANLMHFSQGWVQFGYRFSNDFAPFAMIPVALGIARLGVRPLTVAVVALSMIINAWGVYWGVVQGW